MIAAQSHRLKEGYHISKKVLAFCLQITENMTILLFISLEKLGEENQSSYKSVPSVAVFDGYYCTVGLKGFRHGT